MTTIEALSAEHAAHMHRVLTMTAAYGLAVAVISHPNATPERRARAAQLAEEVAQELESMGVPLPEERW